jgi:hypothetical protein
VGVRRTDLHRSLPDSESANALLVAFLACSVKAENESDNLCFNDDER